MDLTLRPDRLVLDVEGFGRVKFPVDDAAAAER
jgi:hypothetical protein